MKKCKKCGTIYDNCWSKCVHCNHKEYTIIEIKEKKQKNINKENVDKIIENKKKKQNDEDESLKELLKELIEEKKQKKNEELIKKLFIGLIQIIGGIILMYLALK